MRAIIVYESMFGNTRRIAEAIGQGLHPTFFTEIRAASAVSEADLRSAHLIVAGGPTHAWSLCRPRTRQAALQQVTAPGSHLELEPGATGVGLREVFEGLDDLGAAAAAFDTRVGLSRLLTGSAGHPIGRLLKHSGCHLVARPESFLVTRRSPSLIPGEVSRARRWGTDVAAAATRSLNPPATER